jgi:hypothetical protein
VSVADVGASINNVCVTCPAVAMGEAYPLLLGCHISDRTVAAGHLPVAIEAYCSSGRLTLLYWGELEREHMRYIIMSQTWSPLLLTFSIGFDRQFLHISIFTQQGLVLNHLFQMPTTGLTRVK